MKSYDMTFCNSQRNVMFYLRHFITSYSWSPCTLPQHTIGVGEKTNGSVELSKLCHSEAELNTGCDWLFKHKTKIQMELIKDDLCWAIRDGDLKTVRRIIKRHPELLRYVSGESKFQNLS